MVFKKLFFVLVNFLFINSFAQDLISFTKVADLSTDSLETIWNQNGMPKVIVNISNEIELYEIIYTTNWHDGTTILASGLYFTPIGLKKPCAQLIYHHGTQIKKARSTQIVRERAICAGFAADGYAVIMPDYIGLGKGDKKHLYQHADSESDAAIHMYQAVQELNTKINIQTNNQLYLTGYSQGGHACMATHKKIQEQYSNISITASSPMSGAYHMSGAQANVMFSPYNDPAYLPYLLMSYNEIYQIVEEEDLFVEPYKSIIPKLYDGSYDLYEINVQMPNIPVQVVNPNLVEEYLNNPAFKFKIALEENNLIDWATNTPTQLCYCSSDKRVLKENSIVAYSRMKKKGSTNLSLRLVGRKFDHETCAGYAFVYTKLWFNSFRNGSKKGRKGNLIKRIALSLKKAIS